MLPTLVKRCRAPRSLVATRPLKLAVAALLIAGLSGCRQPPAEVFEQAREALKAKQDDEFERLCTKKTRKFLSNARTIVKKSSREFKVLASGRLNHSIMPKGDVVDTVERGHLCVLIVKKGNQRNTVPMRLEQGQWRIDLLEMDSFLSVVMPPKPQS